MSVALNQNTFNIFNKAEGLACWPSALGSGPWLD